MKSTTRNINARIDKPEKCKKVKKRTIKMFGIVFFYFLLSFTNLVLIVFDGIICIESIFRTFKLKPVVFEI